MDESLVRAADKEAKRLHIDRSKLVRTALQRFLRDLRRRSLEEQYRRGYLAEPESNAEISEWEKAQAWPED